MRTRFILPNGKTTISSKTYLTAWRKLYRPIEKATDSKCFGFDPGLSFVTEDGKYVWGLGKYEAIRLSEALQLRRG
jgi:hypothetical protein